MVEVPLLANPTEAAEKTAVTAASRQKSTTVSLQCEQCDYKSTSEKGLKQHARMKHRVSEVAADEDANPSAAAAAAVLKKPVRMLNCDPTSFLTNLLNDKRT